MATLVNWMWFPILREPRWILRMDILQCIGFALLLALPILAGLATRPRALSAVAFALGLGLFFLTPPLEHVKGPLEGFVNAGNNAVFPLLPWAGYVYLGAAVGAMAGTGRPRVLVGFLVGLLAVAWGVWHLAPVLARAYPEHLAGAAPFEHCKRLVYILCAVLVLLAFERFAAPAWTRNGAGALRGGVRHLVHGGVLLPRGAAVLPRLRLLVRRGVAPPLWLGRLLGGGGAAHRLHLRAGVAHRQGLPLRQRPAGAPGPPGRPVVGRRPAAT